MESARPASAADLARVAELRAVAVAELSPLRGGAIFTAREAPAGEDPDVALTSPEHALWVGTIDEVVVGYASAHVERLRTGGRLGRLEELFVEPDARSVGVGEALIGLVVAWCRERECLGIDALALPGSRATKNFFEASGFSARLLVMHHALGGRDTAGPEPADPDLLVAPAGSVLPPEPAGSVLPPEPAGSAGGPDGA